MTTETTERTYREWGYASVGSIKNKYSKQREPFLVLGRFKTAEEFKTALKEEFETDEYDFRTIKWHDEHGLPSFEVKSPSITKLGYLFEDLIWSGK